MPSFTNKNTASTVSVVLFVNRVVASLHHGVPRRIQLVITKPVFSIDERSFGYSSKTVINFRWVPVFVPSQVVLAAHPASQYYGLAEGLAACVHAGSIPQIGTFEKAKGVASK